MSLKRRRGFTLIEMMVALFVGGLALTVIYELFTNFQRQSQHPMVTNFAEQSIMTVAQTLQRDLAETNLQTVRTFPNASSPNEPPGLVCESPRDASENLVLGPFAGGPNDSRFGSTAIWQKYIYYSLSTDAKKPGFSVLTRTESNIFGGGGQMMAQPDSSGGSDETPTSHPATGSKAQRVLSTSMLSTNAPKDNYGGFYIYWNDASGEHPFDQLATQRGEPVTAVISINTGANPNNPGQRDGVSSTGRPTVLKLMLQVRPQN